VIEAFLNLLADTDIYVKVLPDWEIDEKVLQDTLKWVCKLLKALYGLKQAPCLWQKALALAL
jgi:hypothetical protein